MDKMRVKTRKQGKGWIVEVVWSNSYEQAGDVLSVNEFEGFTSADMCIENEYTFKSRQEARDKLKSFMDEFQDELIVIGGLH